MQLASEGVRRALLYDLIHCFAQLKLQMSEPELLEVLAFLGTEQEALSCELSILLMAAFHAASIMWLDYKNCP